MAIVGTNKGQTIQLGDQFGRKSKMANRYQQKESLQGRSSMLYLGTYSAFGSERENGSVD